MDIQNLVAPKLSGIEENDTNSMVFEQAAQLSNQPATSTEKVNKREMIVVLIAKDRKSVSETETRKVFKALCKQDSNVLRSNDIQNIIGEPEEDQKMKDLFDNLSG